MDPSRDFTYVIMNAADHISGVQVSNEGLPRVLGFEKNSGNSNVPLKILDQNGEDCSAEYKVVDCYFEVDGEKIVPVKEAKVREELARIEKQKEASCCSRREKEIGHLNGMPEKVEMEGQNGRQTTESHRICSESRTIVTLDQIKPDCSREQSDNLHQMTFNLGSSLYKDCSPVEKTRRMEVRIEDFRLLNAKKDASCCDRNGAEEEKSETLISEDFLSDLENENSARITRSQAKNDADTFPRRSGRLQGDDGSEKKPKTNMRRKSTGKLMAGATNYKYGKQRNSFPGFNKETVPRISSEVTGVKRNVRKSRNLLSVQSQEIKKEHSRILERTVQPKIVPKHRVSGPRKTVEESTTDEESKVEKDEKDLQVKEESDVVTEILLKGVDEGLKLQAQVESNSNEVLIEEQQSNEAEHKNLPVAAAKSFVEDLKQLELPMVQNQLQDSQVTVKTLSENGHEQTTNKLLSRSLSKLSRKERKLQIDDGGEKKPKTNMQRRSKGKSIAEKKGQKRNSCPGLNKEPKSQISSENTAKKRKVQSIELQEIKEALSKRLESTVQPNIIENRPMSRQHKAEATDVATEMLSKEEDEEGLKLQNQDMSNIDEDVVKDQQSKTEDQNDLSTAKSFADDLNQLDCHVAQNKPQESLIAVETCENVHEHTATAKKLSGRSQSNLRQKERKLQKEDGNDRKQKTRMRRKSTGNSKLEKRDQRRSSFPSLNIETKLQISPKVTAKMRKVQSIQSQKIKKVHRKILESTVQPNIIQKRPMGRPRKVVTKAAGNEAAVENNEKNLQLEDENEVATRLQLKDYDGELRLQNQDVSHIDGGLVDDQQCKEAVKKKRSKMFGTVETLSNFVQKRPMGRPRKVVAKSTDEEVVEENNKVAIKMLSKEGDEGLKLQNQDVSNINEDLVEDQKSKKAGLSKLWQKERRLQTDDGNDKKYRTKMRRKSTGNSKVDKHNQKRSSVPGFNIETKLQISPKDTANKWKIQSIQSQKIKKIREGSVQPNIIQKRPMGRPRKVVTKSADNESTVENNEKNLQLEEENKVATKLQLKEDDRGRLRNQDVSNIDGNFVDEQQCKQGEQKKSAAAVKSFVKDLRQPDLPIVQKKSRKSLVTVGTLSKKVRGPNAAANKLLGRFPSTLLQKERKLQRDDDGDKKRKTNMQRKSTGKSIAEKKGQKRNSCPGFNTETKSQISPETTAKKRKLQSVKSQGIQDVESSFLDCTVQSNIVQKRPIGRPRKVVSKSTDNAMLKNNQKNVQPNEEKVLLKEEDGRLQSPSRDVSNISEGVKGLIKDQQSKNAEQKNLAAAKSFIKDFKQLDIVQKKSKKRSLDAVATCDKVCGETPKANKLCGSHGNVSQKFHGGSQNSGAVVWDDESQSSYDVLLLKELSPDDSESKQVSDIDDPMEGAALNVKQAGKRRISELLSDIRKLMDRNFDLFTSADASTRESFAVFTENVRSESTVKVEQDKVAALQKELNARAQTLSSTEEELLARKTRLEDLQQAYDIEDEQNALERELLANARLEMAEERRKIKADHEKLNSKKFRGKKAALVKTTEKKLLKKTTVQVCKKRQSRKGKLQFPAKRQKGSFVYSSTTPEVTAEVSPEVHVASATNEFSSLVPETVASVTSSQIDESITAAATTEISVSPALNLWTYRNILGSCLPLETVPLAASSSERPSYHPSTSVPSPTHDIPVSVSFHSDTEAASNPQASSNIPSISSSSFNVHASTVLPLDVEIRPHLSSFRRSEEASLPSSTLLPSVSSVDMEILSPLPSKTELIQPTSVASVSETVQTVSSSSVAEFLPPVSSSSATETLPPVSSSSATETLPPASSSMPERLVSACSPSKAEATPSTNTPLKPKTETTCSPTTVFNSSPSTHLSSKSTPCRSPSISCDNISPTCRHLFSKSVCMLPSVTLVPVTAPYDLYSHINDPCVKDLEKNSPSRLSRKRVAADGNNSKSKKMSKN